MVAEAIVKALEGALQALSDLQTQWAVMGGLAVATWGHVRATRDIDLLIAVVNATPDDLVRELAALGFQPRHSPPVLHIAGGRLLQLTCSPPETFVDIQIDLFLAESDFQRAAMERRVKMAIPSLVGEVAVVTCEDLIVLKLLAGRILDLVDAAALLRINRERLDIAYMEDWIARLDLQSAYEEIRREASHD